MKILELTIIKIKNSLDGFNRKTEMIEESISEWRKSIKSKSFLKRSIKLITL